MMGNMDLLYSFTPNLKSQDKNNVTYYYNYSWSKFCMSSFEIITTEYHNKIEQQNIITRMIAFANYI